MIAEIEVERVARPIGGGAVRSARSVLTRLGLVELDDEVPKERCRPSPARAPND